MKVKLEEVERYERHVKMRLAFRFGVITVTDATQAVIKVRVSLPDGTTGHGVAADGDFPVIVAILPPGVRPPTVFAAGRMGPVTLSYPRISAVTSAERQIGAKPATNGTDQDGL